MDYCFQIPAAAWQQLEGAQWPKLTKVSFRSRLGFWAPLGVCVVWSRWLLGCEGDVGVEEVAWRPSRFTGAVEQTVVVCLAQSREASSFALDASCHDRGGAVGLTWPAPSHFSGKFRSPGTRSTARMSARGASAQTPFASRVRLGFSPSSAAAPSCRTRPPTFAQVSQDSL